MRKYFLVLFLSITGMCPALVATAQEAALKIYRAELAKAALAQDPTAGREAAMRDFQQKLYFDNSKGNAALAKSTINELLRLDFVAGAASMLSSSYPMDTFRAMIAQMPADMQAAIKEYFRWVMVSYDAEHSTPASTVPYPAQLPARGYGFGQSPPPAGAMAVSRASMPALPTFTADDLAHRQYGNYNRRHDNTSRIIIDLAHPEKSCYNYQSGTQWGYFQVLQPAQLWDGDQVWWRDSLQVVSIYDTVNVRIGKETFALKTISGPLLTVRAFRLSPDYHDMRCTHCDGRGAIDPKDGGSVTYQRGTVRAEHIERRPDGTATKTTEYNMVTTGSTIKPSFTCTVCNGKGYVHQADYKVEYRR